MRLTDFPIIDIAFKITHETCRKHFFFFVVYFFPWTPLEKKRFSPLFLLSPLPFHQIYTKMILFSRYSNSTLEVYEYLHGRCYVNRTIAGLFATLYRQTKYDTFFNWTRRYYRIENDVTFQESYREDQTYEIYPPIFYCSYDSNACYRFPARLPESPNAHQSSGSNHR